MPAAKGYLEQSRDLGNSLILVAPLLILYEVGLLVSGFKALNGVDFITVLVAQHAGGVKGLLVLNLVLLVGVAAAAASRRRDRRFDPRIAPLVVLESTVYALLLGFAIVSIMHRLPFRPGLETGGVGGSVLTAVVASLGAGVNEELVFRLGIFNLLALAFSRGRANPAAPAVLLAVLVSSVLFSAAHYLGAEPFQVYSFIYRVLAGVIFCGLYLGRGFAVVVYTHAIYDIIVLTAAAARG
jgi:membrane protease YdiL (CAAX protease family)